MQNPIISVSNDPLQPSFIGWSRLRHEIADYYVDCLLKRLDAENIWGHQPLIVRVIDQEYPTDFR